MVLFFMKWMFGELHCFITKSKLSLPHRLLVGIKQNIAMINSRDL